MIQTISMTDLLRNPKKVRTKVKQGFTLHVEYNNKHIFDIQPPQTVSQEDLKKKIPKRPVFYNLNLPETMTKQELYEKYGY
jgi:hypothetical protein